MAFAQQLAADFGGLGLAQAGLLDQLVRLDPRVAAQHRHARLAPLLLIEFDPVEVVCNVAAQLPERSAARRVTLESVGERLGRALDDEVEDLRENHRGPRARAHAILCDRALTTRPRRIAIAALSQASNVRDRWRLAQLERQRSGRSHSYDSSTQRGAATARDDAAGAGVVVGVASASWSQAHAKAPSRATSLQRVSKSRVRGAQRQLCARCAGAHEPNNFNRIEFEARAISSSGASRAWRC